MRLGAVIRRIVLLAGWAGAVLFIWWSVPFVAAYASDPLVGLGDAGGVQPLLRVTLFVWAGLFATALSWLLLLRGGGPRTSAALLAALIWLAYVATTPYEVAIAADPTELANELRRVAYTGMSAVTSLLFALTLSALLLGAEEPRRADLADAA
jgi:hypothetical protein